MINNVTDIDRSSDLGPRARRTARLVTALARLGRDTRGATMVEYAVLVGLLSAGAITLIVATGDTMSKPWTTLADSLPGASDGTVPGDAAAADGPAATGDDAGGGLGGGSGNGASVADGGGQDGDSGDPGEFDVAAAPGGGGGASSGGGGSTASGGGGGTSSTGGTGRTGGSPGGGQGGESATSSGSGQSSGSAATSGGGGGSAGTGSGGGGGGSAGSAGLAGGYVAPGGGGDGDGGGGSQGGAGTTMAEADPAPYGAAETETGTMQASLVLRAKSLGTALLAEGAAGEMGAALLAVGGQGAGSAVAVLKDMTQSKHPWLALLFVLTLIAAFYAIAKRTKSARFKKRMLAIADHRWN
jgi:Flp pilus assembly pilin Flp